MSFVKDRGFKVGQEFIILSQHGRQDRGVGHHEFEIGEKVKLTDDDGSKHPEFTGAGGATWYVGLDHVKPVTEVTGGPKKGVLWSDAPEGATHYSNSELHDNRWHKFVDGVWSFYSRQESKWIAYGKAHQAFEETQVAIPVDKSELLGRVEKAQKRLTRTGSRVGRAEVKLAQAQKNHAEAEEDYKAAKAALAAFKEVKQFYTPEQLVEIAKDPLKWKKGMVVINVSDTALDIPVDNFYTLTEDVRTGFRMNYVQFMDKGQCSRERDAKRYRLDIGQLIGKEVI